MQQLLQRSSLLESIRVRLDESPAVALLGPRQVGKTTLAEQVAAGWTGPSRVFDLEVAATRAALATAPERLLSACEGLVIVDEVQRLPQL